jgi:hypothetical protein
LWKNSPKPLFLGGAALQRCGKSFVLNPALAAVGNGFSSLGVFPAF